MSGDGARGWLRLTVVVSEDGLHCLSGFGEVIVRNLREQMVHHVCSNIVLNLVENSIITINGGKTTAHVAPLLATVPGDLLLRVGRSVVMEVGTNIEPHDKDPVRKEVEVHHSQGAESKGAGGKDTEPGHLESVRGLDQRSLRGAEEIRFWVVVRSVLSRGAVQEVERISKEREGEEEASHLSPQVQALEGGLRGGRP